MATLQSMGIQLPGASSQASSPLGKRGGGSGSAKAEPVYKKNKAEESSQPVAIQDVDMFSAPVSGKGSGKKGGAGRGRAKGMSDGNVAKAMSAMMKAILQLQQQSRDMAGALYETVLIKTDSGIVQAMIEEGKRYGEASRSEEHRRTIGRPHVWIFGAFLTAMCAEKAKAGQADAEVLAQGLAEWSAVSLDERCEHVRFCRRVPTYDREMTRLVFVMDRLPFRAAVLRGLVQLRGIRKHGRAPAGGLEREIQSRLETMMS